jgi:hypothetical protein
MELAPWPEAALDTTARALLRARLALHHAVQVVAAVGQSLAPHAPDDSQQALAVVGTRRWLGAPVAGGRLRAGLDPVGVEVRLCDAGGVPLAGIGLEGRTLGEGLRVLEDALRRAGRPARLALPTHPADFPHHPLADGAAYPEGGAPGRAELARLVRGTEVLLTGRLRVRSPPRLWPHHLDLGCSLPVGDLTLGLGVSPGDAAEGLPYWYATLSPWRWPEGEEPPALRAGAWRRTGWKGAELPLSSLPGDAAGQASEVELFFRSALEVAERLAG